MKLNPKQLDLSKDLVMKGGRIRLSTGTAAAPSIAFVANPDSGLFMNGTSVALSVGSKTAVNVEASGNVTLMGTGALSVHSGATADRPSSPVKGMLRFNSTRNSLETYADSAWVDVVNSNDVRLSTAQTLRVFVSSTIPGTFTSIKAAIDSITDASSTKHYVVRVETGTFNEDPITLKPFITVVGNSTWDTIIQAKNPNVPLFSVASYSGISSCLLTGTTGTGASLVYYSNSTSGLSNSVMLSDVWYGDTDTIAIVDHPTGGYGTLYVDGGIIGGAHNFVNGFVAKNAGNSRINIRNITTNGLTNKINTLFSATGALSTLAIAGSLFRPSSGASVALKLSDGAQARVVGASFINFDTAIWAVNQGAAPGVNADGVNLQGNGQDLRLEHPSTTGHFNGSAERTKVFVDPACPITVFYTDPVATGSTSVGPIYAGPTHASTINISDLIQYSSNLGLINGGVIDAGTGLNVLVSAGYGYAEQGGSSIPDALARLDWGDTTVALPPNSNVFVYVTAGNVWGYGSTLAAPTRNIVFGRVTTDATKVVYVERISTAGKHAGNFINRMLRVALGPVYQKGSLVGSNANTARALDVSGGTFFYGTTQFNPVGGYAVAMTEYYHSGGAWTSRNATVVDNTTWDNGTDLVPMTAGYYAKHSLVMVGDGTYEKYLLIHAQAQFATLVEVEAASIPTPPGFVGSSFVLLASVVVQQGQDPIVEIFDNRPQVGFKSPFLSAAATHGNLLGLDQDDHTQYLLANGGRALTGNLDLGTNNIVNVGLVRGVNVATHASRHLPNGVDPLTTASAVGISLSTSNSTGTANSLARSDHTHVITGVQAQSADLTALAGLTTTGIIARTGSGTAATRTITGTSSRIAVSNGDGVSGNPTVDLVTTGVSQGTYNSLTVDTYGRVTSATNVSYVQTITLTGDITGSGSGSIATTLATVNSNTGSFGSATSVGTFTVNGKGLITAAGSTAIAFPVTSVNGKTGALTLSTTDVGEGTNLYFTTARARASISATGSTTYNSSTGVIASPTLATVATTGSYGDLLNKPTLIQAYRRGITAADINGATNSTLTLTHSLGQMYVQVTVYDKNSKRIEPDEVILVDSTSLQINFTSFASDSSGVSPTSTVIFNVVIVG